MVWFFPGQGLLPLGGEALGVQEAVEGPAQGALEARHELDVYGLGVAVLQGADDLLGQGDADDAGAVQAPFLAARELQLVNIAEGDALPASVGPPGLGEDVGGGGEAEEALF